MLLLLRVSRRHRALPVPVHPRPFHASPCRKSNTYPKKKEKKKVMSTSTATPERIAELHESLAEVRSRIAAAAAAATVAQDASSTGSNAISPTLVAVSKYKPASDILACYEGSQVDFGENYVQELVEKSEQLPREIRWHFIGTFQSNKSKTLASIPNLYSIQTLTSTKHATALQNALPSSRTSQLRVLLQVNTSGEDAKSGLPPLPSGGSTTNEEHELVRLARHILTECPKLHLEGLMTIGSLEQSLRAGGGSGENENVDFARLVRTRGLLEVYLEKEFGGSEDLGGKNEKRWGKEGSGRLCLSMGMSSDYEAAVVAGSDIVRVGTGIFGERMKKGV